MRPSRECATGAADLLSEGLSPPGCALVKGRSLPVPTPAAAAPLTCRLACHLTYRPQAVPHPYTSQQHRQRRDAAHGAGPHCRRWPCRWRGRPCSPRPRGGDHRRRQRRADHGGQRVQAPHQQRFPLDLRVPEPRALLLMPVDPLLHRVDVMNARVSAPGSSGARRDSSARNSRAAFSSWATFPQVIGAQVRAQRRRGADAAEQGAHRAVPQRAHVIDRIRARGHPGDQARDLPACDTRLGSSKDQTSGSS